MMSAYIIKIRNILSLLLGVGLPKILPYFTIERFSCPINSWFSDFCLIIKLNESFLVLDILRYQWRIFMFHLWPWLLLLIQPVSILLYKFIGYCQNLCPISYLIYVFYIRFPYRIFFYTYWVVCYAYCVQNSVLFLCVKKRLW